MRSGGAGRRRRGTRILSNITITFAIITAVVVLFIWNRLPVVVVAMGTALALYATGVLDLNQALAGIGDHAVIFIASLFIVSAGLEITGVTAWAGKLLIAGAGEVVRGFSYLRCCSSRC